MPKRFAPSLLAAGLGLAASFSIIACAEARTRTVKTKRVAAAAVEPAYKPQGPLTIVVSISRQHLTLYEGLQPIASTVVSTGTPGHSTPLGIFSVIQKDRFHRSNLYNDAPMPFMQRITWSGVALHEGHVTGRVASHGCIRLPQAFAQRLWGLTRLGARVIVVQDDVTLAEIDAPKFLTPRPQVDVALNVEPPAELAFPNLAIQIPASIASIAFGEPDVSVEPPAAPWFPAEVTGAEDKVLALEIDPPAPPSFPGLDIPAPVQTAVAEPKNLGIAPPDEAAAPVFDLAQVDAPVDSGPTVEVVDLSLPDNAPLPGAAKPFSLDRSAGPIAIFISKREGKLFVRQNFKPVYDVKVTFAEGSDALGTHLFTAIPGAKAEDVRWSLTTVPSALALQAEQERIARAQRKPVKGVQVAARGDAVYAPRIMSATEALTAVAIPDEARDMLAAAITPGSSLIISDLGFGTETGRGTDFIVQAK